MRRQIRLCRRHGTYNKKKRSNLHNISLFSISYIVSNVIVMENYKCCVKNNFFLQSGIRTGHMFDRTQTFCNWSLQSCNNGISYTSTGTGTCGLGLLWAWMFHKIFACLAYWWGTISHNYYIYHCKLYIRLLGILFS